MRSCVVEGRAKSEVRHERLKVTIGEKQRNIVEDAAGGDQRVDRLADGDAERTEMTIMASGFRRHAVTADVDRVESGKAHQRSVKMAFIARALQYLRQNEVADQQTVSIL